MCQNKADNILAYLYSFPHTCRKGVDSRHCDSNSQVAFRVSVSHVKQLTTLILNSFPAVFLQDCSLTNADNYLEIRAAALNFYGKTLFRIYLLLQEYMWGNIYGCFPIELTRRMLLNIPNVKKTNNLFWKGICREWSDLRWFIIFWE